MGKHLNVIRDFGILVINPSNNEEFLYPYNSNESSFSVFSLISW